MISVCLATFNGARYIKEQIATILPQLSAGDEVIVSDDGSTDNTLDIISSFNDARIHIYHNEVKHGIVGNFENALNKTQGDYIYLADQDDIWESDKISSCQEVLEKGISLVMHDCCIINKDGEITAESYFVTRKCKKGFWNNLYRNSYHGCCMAFNRTLLQKALPFPHGVVIHDWWIALCGERWGTSAFIPKKLLKYRIHDTNATHLGHSLYSRWQQFIARCKMLLLIVKQ